MSDTSPSGSDDDPCGSCSCDATLRSIDRKIESLLLQVKTVTLRLEELAKAPGATTRKSAPKSSKSSSSSSRKKGGKQVIDLEPDEECTPESSVEDPLGLFVCFNKIKKNILERKEFLRSVCLWPSSSRVFCDPKQGAQSIIAMEELWIATLSRRPENCSNGRTFLVQVVGKRGSEGADQRYYGLVTIGWGFLDLSNPTPSKRVQPGFLLKDYQETISALTKSANRAWKPFVKWLDKKFRIYTKNNGYLLAASFAELVDGIPTNRLKNDFRNLSDDSDNVLCKTPIKLQKSEQWELDLAAQMGGVKLNFGDESDKEEAVGEKAVPPSTGKRKSARTRAGSPAPKKPKTT